MKTSAFKFDSLMHQDFLSFFYGMLLGYVALSTYILFYLPISGEAAKHHLWILLYIFRTGAFLLFILLFKTVVSRFFLIDYFQVSATRRSSLDIWKKVFCFILLCLVIIIVIRLAMYTTMISLGCLAPGGYIEKVLVRLDIDEHPPWLMSRLLIPFVSYMIWLPTPFAFMLTMKAKRKEWLPKCFCGIALSELACGIVNCLLVSFNSFLKISAGFPENMLLPDVENITTSAFEACELGSDSILWNCILAGTTGTIVLNYLLMGRKISALREVTMGCDSFHSTGFIRIVTLGWMLFASGTYIFERMKPTEVAWQNRISLKNEGIVASPSLSRNIRDDSIFWRYNALSNCHPPVFRFISTEDRQAWSELLRRRIEEAESSSEGRDMETLLAIAENISYLGRNYRMRFYRIPDAFSQEAENCFVLFCASVHFGGQDAALQQFRRLNQFVSSMACDFDLDTLTLHSYRLLVAFCLLCENKLVTKDEIGLFVQSIHKISIRAAQILNLNVSLNEHAWQTYSRLVWEGHAGMMPFNNSRAVIPIARCRFFLPFSNLLIDFLNMRMIEENERYLNCRFIDLQCILKLSARLQELFQDKCCEKEHKWIGKEISSSDQVSCKTAKHSIYYEVVTSFDIQQETLKTTPAWVEEDCLIVWCSGICKHCDNNFKGCSMHDICHVILNFERFMSDVKKTSGPNIRP